MKRTSIFLSTLAVCACCAVQGLAQIPAPPPAPNVQLRSAAELDQMLGPIALYPDPLIAQILPAATLPSEIVLADRYVTGGGDLTLIDQQSWDPSVKALARYPTILNWLDNNLAWTTALGQAFLYQQQDVMVSIQRLRAQAQALGNLQSTPQENVVADSGSIEILPANPEVIYVPVYQPDMVYFQRPFGSPFIEFGIGLSIGGWLNHDFDWRDHRLIVWRHDQPRPSDWWSRRPGERPPIEVAHATVWQPRNRPGGTSRVVDRGWDSHPASSAVTVIGTQTRPVARPQPVVVQHPVEAPRSRPATGALIGSQSTHEARQFSNRGQESRQVTASRPAAPTHVEAPARSTGGGRH